MTNIARDGAAYRKGLVLGLTMAELMLLLVFCLLIALAALLAQGREALKLAERKIDELTLQAEAGDAVMNRLDEIRELRTRAQRLAEPGGTVDDAWRRLVADAALVERLEKAGADPAALADKAEFVARVAPLAEKRSADQVIADVALAEAVRDELGPAAATPDAAAEKLAALEGAVEELSKALAARPGKRVDLPPIINLRENEGYYFETGSAVLPQDAAARVRGRTVDDLLKLIADYDVDVIEVLGHTDERPLGTARPSNLDAEVFDAVHGGPVGGLVAADNAGLGLARAIAVAQILKGDPRLSGLEILPLSAAQLIGTDGRLSAGGGGDVRERRRIEIRLRRSLAEATSAR